MRGLQPEQIRCRFCTSDPCRVKAVLSTGYNVKSTTYAHRSRVYVTQMDWSARFSAGLSILTFLRMSTWVSSPDQFDDDVIRDTAALARLEGLEGHARAAEVRLGKR